MSTKATTKKSSKPAATNMAKPAAGTKRGAARTPKEAKPKTVKSKATATTTTTDGNLTIVEVPPATIETIGTQKPTKPARKKPAIEPAGKPLSQLEAAVKVLGESTEPLTTKEMVEAMGAKKYWFSPGGKAVKLYEKRMRWKVDPMCPQHTPKHLASALALRTLCVIRLSLTSLDTLTAGAHLVRLTASSLHGTSRPVPFVDRRPLLARVERPCPG
jgi:hypothetical protein